MVVLIGGQRALKVDAHTHLLPSSWSEDHDIPLRLIRTCTNILALTTADKGRDYLQAYLYFILT